MEILIGIVLSGVLEVYKRLAEKWGVKTSRTVIYVVLFVVAAVYTGLTHFGVLTKELVTAFVSVVSSAIATYEMILKPFKEVLEGKE